ncbi:penicillin-binding protein 2 [Entomospira entomophila]|uniref:Penicillin-binding protein 2 n=1 Tax=Entomospira entomophila TaxID=2719988 RepID=A0A968G8I2_9SPIO|nr:penicillin-binding protein 2 [Entomospira entomophilus]NIZ40527.1 penicillin-binding protein 2 [Entomospira entomophilus]WDI36085.1 penicillin-binding protein 2 [Entomospira entomophilus]
MIDKFVDKGKIITLAIITVTLLIVFTVRIFYLQISQGLRFLNASGSISTVSQVLPARRGLIYDRHGEQLVFHEDFFAVYVDMRAIDSEDALIQLRERLKRELELTDSYLERRMPWLESKAPAEAVLIREDVSFEKIAYFAENRELFPGVQWQPRSKRIYSEEAGIAHILGYVAEINEDELQILYNDGYRRGDRIGKSGIEKEYDRYLRGTPGRQYFMVDARGQRIHEIEDARLLAQNGSNLYLTIDMRLQRLAYDALAGRRGSVVVLRPTSGEILAMVSNPVFNANTFSERGSRGLAAQIMDPNFPFINRTISAVYPAASPFKIITETAIVENEVVSPDFKVYCPGYINIGNLRFYCHDRTGHGWQNLSDALANSCNVYFWTIAKDYLGKDSRGNSDPSKIADIARDFGLGAYTEIDLPGEKSGIIPDRAWKEDTYNSPWVGGDTMNMAIGQGFVQVTPLQMANVTAMVANRGTIFKPHVVMRITNEDAGFEHTKRAEVLHQSQISQDSWRRLNQDMRGVVTRGTGWVLTRAASVAGKTGTGETGVDRQFHDWFVAFAPYETNNPEERIVIVVQIEANNNYQWWSTKIADFIIQGYFAEQNYHDVLRTLQPWYMNWRAVTGDNLPPRPLPSTVAVLATLEE